jgi:hypothetical protein
MADQHHVDIPQRGATLGARGVLAHRRGLAQRPRLPVRTLDHPGDDVLEAAKARAPLPGRLVEPKAVIVLDVDTAPRTAIRGYCHVG